MRMRVCVMLGGGAGGTLLNSMYVASTVNFQGWSQVPAPAAAPAPRDGHATVQLNGVLYLHGGWNTSTYFSDVWAFDLTQLTNSTAGWGSTTWVNVIPNSAPTGQVPPARNGHSLSVYDDRMYCFGGFYHNASSGPYTHCTGDVQCVWFNGALRPPRPHTHASSLQRLPAQPRPAVPARACGCAVCGVWMFAWALRSHAPNVRACRAWVWVWAQTFGTGFPSAGSPWPTRTTRGCRWWWARPHRQPAMAMPRASLRTTSCLCLAAWA
jgi:hypothetical protein